MMNIKEICSASREHKTTAHSEATTHLSVVLLWDKFVNPVLTGEFEDTQVMLLHSSDDFIADAEQFFSKLITFTSMSFSV